MKITLEVLQKSEAKEFAIREIKQFEKFCLSRNETEFESVELCPVELIKDDKDAVVWFNPLLVYGCIDTLEELREVVEWQIATDKKSDERERGFCRKSLYYTFTCCSQLYKQDLELFKKAAKHHFVNNLNIECILTYCNEVLTLLPELHKELKNYVDSLDALNKILQ